MVALINLINDLDSKVLVAAPTIPPIMVAQSTNSVLDLLFVPTMTPLERLSRFSNVLSFASTAGSQIYDKGAVTIQVFCNVVNFLSV